MRWVSKVTIVHFLFSCLFGSDRKGREGKEVDNVYRHVSVTNLHVYGYIRT